MYINQQPEQPRCALIVGHPGHELRILAWLTRMQPIVVALTDGSGHLGLPRVDISKTFLLEAGATPSRLYGRLTDKDIYSKLLEQDHAFFVDLAETIADLLAFPDAYAQNFNANIAPTLTQILTNALLQKN